MVQPINVDRPLPPKKPVPPKPKSPGSPTTSEPQHRLPRAIAAKWRSLGGDQWGSLDPEFPQAKREGDGRGSMAQFVAKDLTLRSIVWTRETGAQAMLPAFNSVWRSHGGPHGPLGYPTLDERATHDGVGRFQTFERGLLVWHPQTGIHEVHGAISDRYLEKGKGTRFGYPTTDEVALPDGRGRANHFVQLETGATKSIYWTVDTKARIVEGYIRTHWESLGAERGVLGYPTSDEIEPKDDPAGRFQAFEHGLIVWHPRTGAFEVHGAIRARYDQLGGSGWGYPVTNQSAAKRQGQFNHFIHLPTGEERSIYWTPNHGAVEVSGPIRARWQELHWEHGHLGFPRTAPAAWAEGPAGSLQQAFEGGRILWRAPDGTIPAATAADPVEFVQNMRGGEGFGGHARMRLHSNGTVEFTGEVTNGAFQDYDWSTYAMLRTPTPPPGSTTMRLALAMRRSGHINAQVFGRNENDWGESIHVQGVQDNFFDWQHASYELHTNHEGAITGKIDDVLAMVASWAVAGVVGPAILGYLYVGIELGALVTEAKWNAGPRIMAGSMWMLSPEGYLIGMAVDALTRIGTNERRLSDREKAFLKVVFEGQLDLDEIWVTDTKGMNGREFVFPAGLPDRSVNMNLGDSWATASDADAKFTSASYPALLAHEATHAWQYKHMANATSYVLHGIFDSEYDPGDIDKDWHRYNIEQQGTIVEQWVERNYDSGDMVTFGLVREQAFDDPRFGYIMSNIRTGKGR